MSDKPHRRLGIIAGAGQLPLTVRTACEASGRPYSLLAIEGQACADVLAHAHAVLGYGSIGRAVTLLRELHCEDVVMVGKVGRPDFSALKLDWKGIKVLHRVIAAARRGDDALLSEMGRIFEEEGFRLIGPDDVARDLLAPAGSLTARTPDEKAMADIARAAQVVRALGSFDVGQGAVVCDGLVLAIEAAEGTDAMLRRCAALPETVRGSAFGRHGVLVKLPKPGQERRIDLPTIGTATVEGVAAAGLAGIAIEAEGALMLDRAAITALADSCGVFVYGFAHGYGATSSEPVGR